VSTEKVYIVTSGSYSDYSIDAVFSTQAPAEKFANFYGDGRVEEHDLDPEVPERHPRWSVTMDRDGNDAEAHKTGEWDSEPGRLIRRSTNLGMLHYFKCTIDCENETQAVKAANERRARFIAEGGWPE